MERSSHVALVVAGKGQVKTARVATRLPGEGEMLAEPLMAGVCGTDLQILSGVRPDEATILGHEGVARLIEVAKGVDQFSIGDLVVFNPVDSTDQNHILGHSTPGIFQRQFLITRRAAKGGLVAKFDSRVPLICGPLVEPLGTVIYGHGLVRQVRTLKSIAVVGAGPIGLLNLIYARVQNYQTIFLVHNSRSRLEWAMRRGIVKTEEALLDGPTIAESILERTGGAGVDAVFLCTTRPAAAKALRRSFNYLREGGCVDLVVGFNDGSEMPELPGVELNTIRRANYCGIPEAGEVKCHLTNKGKTVWLTGHRGTSTGHLMSAMKMLRQNHQPFVSVISHVVSLDSAPFILRELMRNQGRLFEGEEVVKIVIDFSIQGDWIGTPEFI